jgi:putative Mg2+ transporter-C (MgtC) family protein
VDGFLDFFRDPDLVSALRLDTLGRLLTAALFGGLVGMERELSGKPVGLRTNLLICVGASLLTELSLFMAGMSPGHEIAVRGDPGRIAAQIIPGIGFIGAGSILHARGKVTGLTTAATLWVVAAIGMAVGMRAYVEAAGTTVLVLVTLFALRYFEAVVRRRRTHRRYRVTVLGEETVDRVEAAFCDAGVVVKVDGMQKKAGLVEVLMTVTGPAKKIEAASRGLMSLREVRAILRA